MAKGKKEFFSSFEENLSFGDDKGTTIAAKPSKTGQKANITNITDTTNITEKAEPTKVTTFRIKLDVLEKVKAIAYWEREKIQDVLNKALNDYLEAFPEKELDKALKAYKK